MLILQVPIGGIFQVYNVLIAVGAGLVMLNFISLLFYLIKRKKSVTQVLFISGMFMILAAFALYLMEDRTAEKIALLVAALGLFGIIIPFIIKPVTNSQ